MGPNPVIIYRLFNFMFDKNEYLNLVEVFNKVPLGQIIISHYHLYVVINELTVCLEILRNSDDDDKDVDDMLDRLKEIWEIENELEVIKHNFDVLEKALLCHESNVFKWFSFNDHKFEICLN